MSLKPFLVVDASSDWVDAWNMPIDSLVVLKPNDSESFHRYMAVYDKVAQMWVVVAPNNKCDVVSTHANFVDLFNNYRRTHKLYSLE